MFSLKTYQKLWTVLSLTYFVIISVHNNLYTLRTWSCSRGTRVKDQDFILYEMQSLIDDFLWFLHLVLYFSAWTESNSKQQTSNYIPCNTYLTRQVAITIGLNQEKEVTGKNMLNFFLFFFFPIKAKPITLHWFEPLYYVNESTSKSRKQSTLSVPSWW